MPSPLVLPPASDVPSPASGLVESPGVLRTPSQFGISDSHDSRRGSSGPGAAWGSRRRWIPRPDDRVRHPARTLIVCHDGTGDMFDADNSNIVQLVSMLKKDDPSRQMVYYQPGIGTSTDSSSGFRAFSKAMDLMVAWTLDQHVQNAYDFLMQNYSEGDRICIFGFSRGAYTALGLAGMLQKVGLLPPYNRQQLPFAYHMYAREDAEALALATEFKATFSIDVTVDFVGVWDTVSSVGVIPQYLPFVTSNSAIRYFRHALALDEHRVKFMPNFHRKWEGSQGITAAHPHQEDTCAAQDTPCREPPERHASVQQAYEEEINRATGMKTDSLEVWFAGAHADVGGGSVPNHTRHSLARIPLRWMIRECFRTATGIIFDANMLRDQLGMDVDVDGERVLDPPPPLHPGKHDHVPAPRLAKEPELDGLLLAAGRSLVSGLTLPFRLVGNVLSLVLPFRTRAKLHSHGHGAPNGFPLSGGDREPFRGEAAEELHDALSPAYDQLRLAWFWWILEYIPLRMRRGMAVFDTSNVGADYHWLINRGEGRKVFKAVVAEGLKVHRSVRIRLQAAAEHGVEYVPHIKPNIHANETGVPEDEVKICRRLTHQEWLDGGIAGVKTDRPLIEWV